MKVNPVGNKYSEVDRAYLAGFLDADGAIMATIERHREKKFGFRVRIILKITQQNRKVLDWFCKHFQVGSVAKNRTTHDWLIKDQKDAEKILRIVYSFLKVKKTQARKALSILDMKIIQKKDLLKAAHLADSLSRLNVRSKNRRKNHASMI
jgi:hypothetical protein